MILTEYDRQHVALLHCEFDLLLSKIREMIRKANTYIIIFKIIQHVMNQSHNSSRSHRTRCFKLFGEKSIIFLFFIHRIDTSFELVCLPVLSMKWSNIVPRPNYRNVFRRLFYHDMHICRPGWLPWADCKLFWNCIVPEVVRWDIPSMVEADSEIVHHVWEIRWKYLLNQCYLLICLHETNASVVPWNVQSSENVTRRSMFIGPYL